MDDVFVIVVYLHHDGSKIRVQGTRTGAVVVTHLGSPVLTDGWHYFNGLPH